MGHGAWGMGHGAWSIHAYRHTDTQTYRQVPPDVVQMTFRYSTHSPNDVQMSVYPFDSRSHPLSATALSRFGRNRKAITTGFSVCSFPRLVRPWVSGTACKRNAGLPVDGQHTICDNDVFSRIFVRFGIASSIAAPGIG